MARRVINDTEAKQLVEKLNRRMGAISLLTGGHFSLQAWLIQTGVFLLATGLLYFSERREDWLLFVVVGALVTLVEIYNAAVNRRIDALVELLRQEGMLHAQLPPDSVQEA